MMWADAPQARHDDVRDDRPVAPAGIDQNNASLAD
jgi:hypothetical protein